MPDTAWFILALSLLATVFSFWYFFYELAIVVDSPDKVVVLRNKFFRWNLRVVWETSFWGPWWRLHDGEKGVPNGVVDLSRIPVLRRKADDPEVVRCSGGAELIVEHEYDVMLARRVDLFTGRLERHPDDINAIKQDPDRDKLVLNSIIRTESMKDQIRRVISSSLEQEFGRYPADDLLAGGVETLRVPLVFEPVEGGGGRKIYRLDIEVLNTAAMLRTLSDVIEFEVNRRLREFGYSIIGFNLIGISPRRPELQQAVELPTVNRRKAIAANQLRQDLNNTITHREALAEPAQLGEVAKAQALHTLADAGVEIGRAAIDAAREIKEGVIEGTRNIADGLAGRRRGP